MLLVAVFHINKRIVDFLRGILTGWILQVTLHLMFYCSLFFNERGCPVEYRNAYLFKSDLLRVCVKSLILKGM